MHIFSFFLLHNKTNLETQQLSGGFKVIPDCIKKLYPTPIPLPIVCLKSHPNTHEVVIAEKGCHSKSSHSIEIETYKISGHSV